MEVNIKINIDEQEASLEDALSILNGKIKTLERTIVDLEEANEHLSDGLESTKKKVEQLEKDVDIRKIASIFQRIADMPKNPKPRLKETTVDLDEGNKT